MPSEKKVKFTRNNALLKNGKSYIRGVEEIITSTISRQLQTRINHIIIIETWCLYKYFNHFQVSNQIFSVDHFEYLQCVHTYIPIILHTCSDDYCLPYGYESHVPVVMNTASRHTIIRHRIFFKFFTYNTLRLKSACQFLKALLFIAINNYTSTPLFLSINYYKL